MDDSIYISLRFTLYIDLMLLFGLALFGLYSLCLLYTSDAADE